MRYQKPTPGDLFSVDRPETWPRDLPSYTFLARAYERAGKNSDVLIDAFAAGQLAGALLATDPRLVNNQDPSGLWPIPAVAWARTTPTELLTCKLTLPVCFIEGHVYVETASLDRFLADVFEQATWNADQALIWFASRDAEAVTAASDPADRLEPPRMTWLIHARRYDPATRERIEGDFLRVCERGRTTAFSDNAGELTKEAPAWFQHASIEIAADLTASFHRPDGRHEGERSQLEINGGSLPVTRYYVRSFVARFDPRELRRAFPAVAQNGSFAFSVGEGSAADDNAPLSKGVKGSPLFDRAKEAIRKRYPSGVPPQSELPNPHLLASLKDDLKGPPTVSDTTILRAAGRRK
jgi:hypothetical protein